MARRQLGTAPSNAADTATKGYVDTGTATLENKTISGASNTITNLPVSATPNAARLVVTTQGSGDGVGTADGFDTWTKLLTWAPGANNNKDLSLLLSVQAGNTVSAVDVALVAVYFRQNPSGGDPSKVNVQIIAKAGIAYQIDPDSFKVVCNGYNSNYELWMKKGNAFAFFNVFELGRSGHPEYLTYSSNPGWQLAGPTGTITASSNGVTAFDVPVVTTTGTATLENKTIKNPTVTDSNGNAALTFSSTASAANYVRILNGADGGVVGLDAAGSSSNIPLSFATKGATPDFYFYAGSNSVSRIVASAAGANCDLNLRSQGTGTVQANGVPVVTTTGTQSLSNKTLSSPTLTTPKIASILDANGNVVIQNLARTNAVNYLAIANSATGNDVELGPTGSDVHIGLKLGARGTTKPTTIIDGSGNEIAEFYSGGAGAVNHVKITSVATGNAAKIAAVGDDANVSLNLQSQGSGTVQANGNPVGVKVSVPSTATSTGVEGQWAADSSYIYVCTAANTWRRVAIASW